MNIVVAVDLNWGIGKNGTQTVVLPEDRVYFRNLTRGGTVIVGRKTLADFPGGRPLKNRRNIVLTTNPDCTIPSAEIAHSVGEAIELCRDDENVYVIGGASVYEQFLPFCKYAFVTKLYVATDSDSYFHDLDSDPNWQLCGHSDELLSGDIKYAFLKYENLNCNA